jgi:hypothetical protein
MKLEAVKVKLSLCFTKYHSMKAYGSGGIFPHILTSALDGGEWSASCQEGYEVVTKSFRTGRLEQELQMVELYATRLSYITIL